jgi:ribosomal protein L7/L12
VAAAVVTAVAVAAMVPADSPAAEEKIDFDVFLKAMGDKKLRSLELSAKLQD